MNRLSVYGSAKKKTDHPRRSESVEFRLVARNSPIRGEDYPPSFIRESFNPFAVGGAFWETISDMIDFMQTEKKFPQRAS